MISLNFLLLLIAYLFITFSILGYGLFLEKVYEKNNWKRFRFYWFIRDIFLILYSYISHYFVSHNIYHNSIIMIVGFILFIFL